MDLVKCWSCKKPDCNDTDEYCSNCGVPLHNFCTNPECPCSNEDDLEMELEADNCFCPHCGYHTLFMTEGLITQKTYED